MPIVFVEDSDQPESIIPEPLLESKNLLLPELKIEDVKALADTLNHPTVLRRLGAPKSFKAHDYAKLLCTRHIGSKDFGIHIKETGILVGCIMIYPTPEPFRNLGVTGPAYSFGVWVKTGEQGKGIAREGLEAVLSRMFRKNPKLNFIHGSCFKTNKASIALMQSLGFYQLTDVIYKDKTSANFVIHRDHSTFNYDQHFSLRQDDKVVSPSTKQSATRARRNGIKVPRRTP